MYANTVKRQLYKKAPKAPCDHTTVLALKVVASVLHTFSSISSIVLSGYHVMYT